MYREVLRRAPDQPDALHLLGVIAHHAGREDEALRLISRAISLRDSEPGYYSNLGLVHEALHHHDQAAACYRQALALDPGFAEANSNLGGILANHIDLEEAVTLCRRALAARPDFPQALCNLGLACSYQGRLDLAVEVLEKALALWPECIQAWHNLGTVFSRQNRQERAIACFERALTLKPDYVGAYDSLYFSLLYRAGTRPEALFAAHRRYAAQFEAPFKSRWPRHGNDRDPVRRLRVGYVSPDFRNHSVGYFAEPLLAAHDKSDVEVWCYYNGHQVDVMTERFRAYADHWVPCRNLSDDELSARILADRIDILVDLAGHSANNRLRVFARKPAPVQVTWLGYPTTTGLDAIDWRMTTREVDPEGSESCHSERLWRLPRTMWCYRPPEDIAASPVPAPARDGIVRFGSMNNFPKISPEAVALWCRVLRELPRAGLVMTGVPEGSAREALLATFAAQGIEADRLEIHDRVPAPEFRALSARIDIALDSFPYNGTTTTCESLCMGIPVITLSGDSSVARSGHALLGLVGLDELCARDEAGYVGIAVALARDLPRLAALRAGLRERVMASSLRDEAGFARDIESAFRAMWTQWCDGRYR